MLFEIYLTDALLRKMSANIYFSYAYKSLLTNI